MPLISAEILYRGIFCRQSWRNRGAINADDDEDDDDDDNDDSDDELY